MDNRNGNINKAQLLSCLKQVRDQLHDQAPLIHCITHPLWSTTVPTQFWPLEDALLWQNILQKWRTFLPAQLPLPSALEILQMQGLSPCFWQEKPSKNERC